MTILLIIYTILLLVLLATNYSETLMNYHTAAKTICSLGFIAVSVFAYMESGNSRLFYSLLPTFIFCLLGDYFLSLPESSKEGLKALAGPISFTLAHIFSIIAFTKLVPIQWYDFILPVITVFILLYVSKLPEFTLEKVKYPISFYGFLLAFAFTRTISIVSILGFSFQNGALFAGYLLFAISDIFLFLVYFYKKKNKWYSIWNLILYYYGMFLLAVSIYQ